MGRETRMAAPVSFIRLFCGHAPVADSTRLRVLVARPPRTHTSLRRCLHLATFSKDRNTLRRVSKEDQALADQVPTPVCIVTRSRRRASRPETQQSLLHTYELSWPLQSYTMP